MDVSCYPQKRKLSRKWFQSMMIGIVLCCESVSAEFRSIIPLLGNVIWVAGYMAVGVVAIFVHNWRWHYFVLMCPAVLTISYYWLVPFIPSFCCLIFPEIQENHQINSQTKRFGNSFSPSCRLLPESLHWMITQKKAKGIKEYIEKASKFNGMTIDLEECMAEEADADDPVNAAHKKPPKRSILDIFKTPMLCYFLLLHAFIKFDTAFLQKIKNCRP